MAIAHFFYLFNNYKNLSMQKDFQRLGAECFGVWILIKILEKSYDYFQMQPDRPPFMMQFFGWFFIFYFIFSHFRENGTAWQCLSRQYIASTLNLAIYIRIPCGLYDPDWRSICDVIFFIAGGIVLNKLVKEMHQYYGASRIRYLQSIQYKDLPPE